MAVSKSVIPVLASALLAEPRFIEADYRAAAEGALIQLDGEDGCVDDDGEEGCADGHALDDVFHVAVSPDGKSVYVTSGLSQAVAVFARDRRTGALTQLEGEDGCVDNDGEEGCADGRALDFVSGMALSLDGKSVYVGSIVSDAVAVFARR